jgi:hypothetical protein
VREAVITPFEDLHEASLRSMGTVFARIASVGEPLFEPEPAPGAEGGGA